MENSFFRNKIAVVTGGGGTICSEIAIQLAKNGAKVAIFGRKLEKLRKTEEKIKALGGECLPLSVDVSDEAAVLRAAEEVYKAFGPCDFLVNGAGGNNPKAVTANSFFQKEDLLPRQETGKLSFFNVDMGDFKSVIDVNLIGAVICCRVFGAQMAEKGSGAIINFASMNSYCPLSCRPAYAMSKAAIVNFTQWLASYLAPAGVRVNAVAPGFVANENNVRFNGSPETGYTPRGMKIIERTPMGRFSQAGELWGAVEWLLDDEKAGFVTGVTLPVDGGFLSYSGL